MRFNLFGLALSVILVGFSIYPSLSLADEPKSKTLSHRGKADTILPMPSRACMNGKTESFGRKNAKEYAFLKLSLIAPSRFGGKVLLEDRFWIAGQKACTPRYLTEQSYFYAVNNGSDGKLHKVQKFANVGFKMILVSNMKSRSIDLRWSAQYTNLEPLPRVIADGSYVKPYILKILAAKVGHTTLKLGKVQTWPIGHGYFIKIRLIKMLNSKKNVLRTASLKHGMIAL